MRKDTVMSCHVMSCHVTSQRHRSGYSVSTCIDGVYVMIRTQNLTDKRINSVIGDVNIVLADIACDVTDIFHESSIQSTVDTTDRSDR
jgi:hypothetical protein